MVTFNPLNSSPICNPASFPRESFYHPSTPILKGNRGAITALLFKSSAKSASLISISIFCPLRKTCTDFTSSKTTVGIILLKDLKIILKLTHKKLINSKKLYKMKVQIINKSK